MAERVVIANGRAARYEQIEEYSRNWTAVAGLFSDIAGNEMIGTSGIYGDPIK